MLNQIRTGLAESVTLLSLLQYAAPGQRHSW